jgi:hypothetical protein
MSRKRLTAAEKATEAPATAPFPFELAGYPCEGCGQAAPPEDGRPCCPDAPGQLLRLDAATLAGPFAVAREQAAKRCPCPCCTQPWPRGA